MIGKVNTFYKQNTPFALMIGGCFIAASLTAFNTSGIIYGNNFLDKTIMFLYIIGLFIQIRKYRESKELGGAITFGKALTTGIWISLICSVLYAVYTGMMYRIYPELLEHYLNFTEQVMNEAYPDSDWAENMNKLMRAITTPFVLGFAELFSKIISGTLYSLLIAAILRKQN
ncbi:DUF4199 domain-containing protein [Odoribacter sp. OttesenSCG-928-G04]|nr:DUF4199 domain-containing protein [Odoribacter sp. OttesenSCG-928-G04]